ncbi:uncharacterized protein ACIBXB_008457 isoform 2-T2 [Morphnus guianensis]
MTSFLLLYSFCEDLSFKSKQIQNICKRNQLTNNGPMKLVALMFLGSVKYYGQTVKYSGPVSYCEWGKMPLKITDLYSSIRK